MAQVRRSLRLSSNGRSTPITTTSTAIRRGSDIWNRRQTSKSGILSESDEEENIKQITIVESDAENNENCNVMNKLQASRGAKGKSTKMTTTTLANKSKSTSKAIEVKRKAQEEGMPRNVGMTSTNVVNKQHEATNKRKSTTKNKILEILSNGSSSTSSEDDSEDEAVRAKIKVSPPKQARKARHSRVNKLVISPSRLIDRLSIDERNEADQAGTKETQEESAPTFLPEVVTPKRNKYQSARRALNSAETNNLPGREQQLQELREFFTDHLDNQRSGSLYVSGQPGTGKTACLSLLLHSPEFAQRLQRVYINCTSISSVGSVYKKLCSELKLDVNGRTERDYLMCIQHHLKHVERMVLIVLDEIDQLCRSKQSVLYTIFEWPALPGARVILVGIANSLDLTDRALMRLNARCDLKPRLMHFPPYTKQQIIDIFKSRLEECDVLDVFPAVTLQLLAAKVSAVSGDVRRALDIGRRVVEIAAQTKKDGRKEVYLNDLNNIQGVKGVGADNEDDGSLKPVQITQVAAVLNKVYGASQNLQEDIEDSFPLQQKIMLCTLMLMLRKERNKDISIGRLHEVYRRICQKRNIHALDQTEFAGLVDLVETRGILRLVRKKEPRFSKVHLAWDEDEVNAALSDKQLIASILDDTECLSKS